MAADATNPIASLSQRRPIASVSLEAAVPTRAVSPHAGHLGSETTEMSRSARAYVVTQKRAEPLIKRRPRGSALGLESIIGADDRKRILDTDLLPWRMICALEMTGADDGVMIGTGWLVGPRTIITAGHCVYLNEFGPKKWAKQIKVMPGRNGADHPFAEKECTVQDYSVHAKWMQAVDGGSSGQDYDIGCIHLARPIGNELGWFGVEAIAERDLVNYMVNISGYPADRGGGAEQYFHANRIRNVTPRRVFYDVDTYGGQSGSPVWIQQDVGGAPTVIGIHAYGTNVSEQLNSAPRIDAEVLELIKFWVSEDEKAAPVS